MYTKRIESPLGAITLAGEGQNLTGLWFEGQKYYGASLAADAVSGELPVFELAERWLGIYFTGKKPEFTLPVAPEGSAFRQAVWNELLKIPFGKVTTYGEIAKRLNTSARAVGSAIGRNPISILIPCHRVIGSDGSLTGYAGGIDRKIALLKLEGYIHADLPQIEHQ